MRQPKPIASIFGGGEMSNLRLPQTSTGFAPASRRRCASGIDCASTRAKVATAGRITALEPPPTFEAALRQPRVRQHHRHRCAPCAACSRLGQTSVSMITPTAGAKRLHEAARGARRVEGQPGLHITFVQQLAAGLDAGGGAAGQHQAHAGHALAQRLDQRLGGARFAHRHRVHPHVRTLLRRPRQLAPIKTKALADALAVRRLLAARAPQAQHVHRRQRAQHQRIERVRQAGRHRTSP